MSEGAENERVDGEPEVAERRPRSRAARNQYVIFFNFVLTVVVLAIVAVGGGIWYSLDRFDAPNAVGTASAFSVEQGSSLSAISASLENRGLIESADIFKIASRTQGYDASLKAGDYEIPPHASMRQILEMLQNGDVVDYRITIPEGWTVWQAMQRIAANPDLSGDLPEEMPPEGSLIANTQTFPRGMERQALIEAMSRQQQQLVEQIWNGRDEDLPIDTIEEFLTLASIVEKETGVAEERPEVAAVFVNRLREGMRLQSDPTIIYGLFGGEGKPADRPIYRSDIDRETPYNTYAVNGLPPGPIAIPGRAALEAVAHPDSHDYLYFVADGTGGHAFAETLDEHNANVRAWRQIEAQRGIEAAEREPVQGDGSAVDG